MNKNSYIKDKRDFANFQNSCVLLNNDPRLINAIFGDLKNPRNPSPYFAKYYEDLGVSSGELALIKLILFSFRKCELGFEDLSSLDQINQNKAKSFFSQIII